ncbi:terminase small subunit, Nu1 [Thalassospira sp.]|uniref:terminase small subunit, Nu1 n=1 Tax=Thalassospira sp. TaxID=1912094 RepID=UPI001AFF84D1|nr:terminase small subunit, Nu1 [Thalassospira sp.]MBO6522125.1 terminase small subunit, Nu1 [Rhodospirillales bacterium]MBO6773761.1 terminase small subunit, Nu1 [Thalassospira sp.]
MSDNTQPISVISSLLDISERRVQQLSKAGVIPKAARGRYELIGSVRGYIRHLRDLNLKGEAGNADYGTERARLVKAKADLAEMEASQMRGDLLSAPDVKVAWTEIVALMRARLLVLPDKIAPVVHETTNLNQARDVIKKAIHEVLTEIAETDVEIVPHIDGDESAATGGETNVGSGSAASRSDRKSVGGQK